MKFLTAVLLMGSFSSFAHVEFTGTIKGTNTACSLEIEQTYFENNIETDANFRADIHVLLEASDHKALSHGDELNFTLKFVLVNILSGTKDKDQINVMINAGSKHLDEPTAFALKWWHTNHFHSAQCVNLSRVQE